MNAFEKKTLDVPVALVTGAAGGIGAGISKALARTGDRVIVSYNHSAIRAMELVREINSTGGWAVAHQADVTNPESIQSLVEQVIRECGRLDILVNNAGHFKPGSLYSTSREDWITSFSCNLLGVYNCTSACAPHMTNVGSAIINIGSLTAIYPSSNALAYAVSKAGVITLTKCLAGELGPKIRVNCVVPGLVKTNMTEKLDSGLLNARADVTALKRLCTIEDVASAVVYLAHDANYMTGQILILDGGMFLR